MRNILLRSTRYSTAFGVCLSFYCFFWLSCVTTVTPFIERSEGWSLRSGRVLDQSGARATIGTLSKDYDDGSKKRR